MDIKLDDALEWAFRKGLAQAEVNLRTCRLQEELNELRGVNQDTAMSSPAEVEVKSKRKKAR